MVGDNETALRLAEDERRVNPRQPALLAEMADSYSMLGRRDEAVAAAGYSRPAIEQSPGLAELRRDKRYRAL